MTIHQIYLLRPTTDVDLDALSGILHEYIDSEQRVTELLQYGGIVADNLGNEEAQAIRERISATNARTLLEPMDATGELYRVRVTGPVDEDRRDEIHEFFVDFLGIDEEQATELVEGVGIVLENIPRHRAQWLVAELEERGVEAETEQVEFSPDEEFVVEGQVRQESETGPQALRGVTVRVFDQDVRGRRSLGEAKTNGDGEFSVSYGRFAFEGDERGSADLVFRVLNESGSELAARTDRDTVRYKDSEVLMNAEQREVVDLLVEADQPVVPSEFESLETAISNLGLDDAGDLSAEEIAFVALEIGYEENLLQTFVESHQLSESAEMGDVLSPEVFYGLLRRGLPSDLDDLLQRDTDELRTALEEAIESNTVPRRLQDSLDEIITRFDVLRDRRKNWVEYDVAGHLFDQVEEQSLAGYTIRVVDVGFNIRVGETITDESGQFSLSYRLPEDADETRTLRISLRDPIGNEISLPKDTFEEMKLTEPQLEFTVELPEPPRPGDEIALEAAELEEAFTRLQINPEQRDLLLDDLTSRDGIETLADVRGKGGLGSIEGLPLEADDPAVKTLERLSLFTTIPSVDVGRSVSLIEQGFETPFVISRTPIRDFIASAEESDIPAREGVRLHTEVSAAVSHINNGLTKIVTEYENGILLPEGSKHSKNEELVLKSAPVRCDCEDCDSAVSPRAYLADLIDYVLKGVKRTDGRIYLTDLVSHFRQPFDALPASCEATEEEIRQVRICIEILSRYLGRWETDGSAELQAAERHHRERTYERLLIEFGTSYDELVEVFGTEQTSPADDSSEAEKQKRLAERLRVPHDHLKELYLEGGVTESALEELFGFVSTERSPTEPGPNGKSQLRDVGPSKVERWRLAHLREEWKEEDWAKNTYTDFEDSKSELPIIDPDIVTVDDFRDPDPSSSKAFQIWQKRREWVDKQMRELRRATPGDNPDIASMLDAMYQENSFEYLEPHDGPWENGPMPSEFEELLEKATGTDEQGSKEKETKTARQRIETELGLTLEELSRLLELRKKQERRDSDPSAEVISAEEWTEACSILTQRRKEALSEIWIQEEKNAQVTLDPKIFWVSLREPGEGEWSDRLHDNRPLIDPELITQKDLADVTQTEVEEKFYTDRREELEAQYEEIRQIRESNSETQFGGIVKTLQVVYGETPPSQDSWVAYLTHVEERVQSLDSDTTSDAVEEIRTELRLDQEKFEHVLTIFNRVEGGPDREVSDPEWERIYSALTTALKLIKLYPGYTENGNTHDGWIAEEKEAPPLLRDSTASTGLQYWELLKARLPKWRASSEERSQWQQALAARSARPTVDPDLFGVGEMRSPTPTNPVQILWSERTQELSALGSQIQSTLDPDNLPNDMSAYDSLLQRYLGITRGEVYSLERTSEDGEDVSDRLEQLTLSYDAFEILTRFSRRLENAIENTTDVSSDLWNEIVHILVDVTKRRSFAEWRDEERTTELPTEWQHEGWTRGILLAPELLQLSGSATRRRPSADDPERWRFDRRARRDWENRLESRIDQQRRLGADIQEAVGDVEETVLPQLRNALIAELPEPGDERGKTQWREDRAEWVIETFLIDSKTSGCQETTRISQAIETLQTFVETLQSEGPFKLNTEQDGIRDVDLDDPFFAKQWKWLQSYATWKAAMATYLYPENVLSPTLRRQQTPVFRGLTDDFGPSRRITPTEANKAARRYSRYFRDICTLTVEATCWLSAPSTRDDEDGDAPAADTDRFFLVGRGGREDSNDERQAYWASYDKSPGGAGLDYRSPVTFWEPIPEAEDVNDIIGVSPYKEKVYLFVKRYDEGNPTLEYLVYNIEEQEWSPAEELDLPDEITVEAWRVVRKWKRIDKGLDLLDKDPQFTPLNNNVPVSIELTQVEEKVSDTSDYSAVLLQQSSDESPPELVISRGIETEQRSIVINSVETEHKNPIVFQEYTIKTETKEVLMDGYHSNIFRGKVDASEGGWQDDEWNPTFISSIAEGATEEEELVAAVDLSHGFAVFTQKDNYVVAKYGLDNGTPLTKKKTIEVPYGGQITVDVPQSMQVLLGSGIGALRLGTSSSVYVFSRLGVFGPAETSYHLLDFNEAGTDTTFHKQFETPQPAPFDSVPPYENQAANRQDRTKTELIYYRGSGTPKRGVFTHTADGVLSGGDLQEEITPSVPSGKSSFRISQTYSDLNARRNIISSAFSQTPVNQRTNREYLKEAYYFVPTVLALRLQRSGEYEAALNWFRTTYDYSQPEKGDNRKIFYGLVGEDPTSLIPDRGDHWLHDPTDVHSLAENRTNSYTRFTQLSIVRCLLDYADAEFTRDTAESVPRARRLYTRAFDLFDAKELKRSADMCESVKSELETLIRRLVSIGATPSPDAEVPVYSLAEELRRRVDRLDDQQLLAQAIADIGGIPKITDPAELDDVRERLESAHTEFDRIESERRLQTYADVAQTREDPAPAVYTSVLADQTTARTVAKSSAAAGRYVLNHRAVAAIEEFSSQGNMSLLSPATIQYDPAKLPYDFCIPRNPILSALRTRAEMNLRKIRNCMNIAGMRRQLDPYAAPTDLQSSLPQLVNGRLVLPGTQSIQPTQYRYRTLVGRAKELVNISQQIESAFLNALERRDAEKYTLLKARQEVEVGKANVRLQSLRVSEAKDGVGLASLQRERVEIQQSYYDELLSRGNLWQEEAALRLSHVAAVLSGAAGAAHLLITPTETPDVAASLSSFASATSIESQILSTLASYERRRQEWEHQSQLAAQDLLIADQQIRIAERHVDVVEQERDIAELQSEHASDTVEFLNEKFTNRALYEWMIGVLEDVYRFFLQQATATAKLAENQLAFERQQLPPGTIQADYWEIPSEGQLADEGETQDRRGLTGSARLLQDIYQLDQYAFETDERKHQITKTVSLAQNFPAEFQRFRENGEMTFETPMEWFDRDFPGHYLRLIKRVRTSVIALIPPNEGIKATLTNSGISRVTTGGDVFQTSVVRRSPESVALSSPRDATGSFELQPQTDSEMLNPFEATGVDSRWMLRMPKGSNQFDYDSIADVLVTIEYTALSSEQYRQQVLEELDNEISADRAFSFRENFSDQWYDLHNPDQTDEPMTVRFETTPDDFPPNIGEPQIRNVLLYFAGAEGGLANESEITLQFKGEKSTNVTFRASPDDGIVSTRRKQWEASMSGMAPFGEWTLKLPNSPAVRRQFAEDKIEDILLVVTYNGEAYYGEQ